MVQECCQSFLNFIKHLILKNIITSSIHLNVLHVGWTFVPQPPFSFPVRRLGGGGREIRSEAEPRKKGRVGGRCLKIYIDFSLSYSDLIGDKYNFFPLEVQLVLPVTVVGE